MASFPETIVFDLDGTLVDTAPDLTAALNAVMRREGRSEVALHEVRNMVGRGARVLIERAMAATGAPVSDEAIAALMQHFLVHYDANIAAGSRPFDAVEAVAKRLAERGHKLGICTNKPEALSLKLMSELGLRELFPVILGADSRPYRKPDPRHLLDTISGLGGDPKNAVLVGDSETDVKTARAANVPVVVVSFGYTEIPPSDLGADAVIDHFDALEQALKSVRRLT
ncbi:MAG: phosphoglycolate phosphatase [Alphaproteobacteria bacterium]|nr:phosphoglycolate phosphatase [Alphaproteobacteria bacterium]